MSADALAGMTRSQRRLYDQTTAEGWVWEAFNGSETAMVRRMIKAGHLVEVRWGLWETRIQRASKKSEDP